MAMLFLVIVVFTFAGMVKGTIGLGLPTVAMGLLTFMITPFQAASLLIVPSAVTNIWQLFAEGHIWRLLKRFWSLLLGIVVGTLWSFLPTLSDGQGQSSEMMLGILLVLYGLYGLWVKQLPNLSQYEKWLSPIVGYVGGAVILATGVIIIPVVLYLQALYLKKNDLVQALGLVFTIATFCLAIFLHQHPVQGASLHPYLAWIAVIPALLGMWIGQKIRHRIPEQKFRRIFFIGLLCLGTYMVLQPLF
ncbi:MAG: sulfite exporter TauE/SafE family protein [Acinetobacter sp.]